MTPRRSIDILASFLLLFSIAACGGKPGTADSNAANAPTQTSAVNATRTNVEELGMIINIPYQAEESVWRMDAGQKKLVAVLRFSSVDSDRVTADAAQYRPAENVAIPSEVWFPDELIAQSDMSGDDTLKGISYGANLFFQDAFNDGRIIRIEGTNYFVLEMTSK